MNRFQLEKLTCPWKVQGSCAKTGEGLLDGLEWIHEKVNKPKKKIQDMKDSMTLKTLTCTKINKIHR